MSAKTAPVPASSPKGRRNRRLVLPVSASAVIGAMGLGLLLAAGSINDVSSLSDAMGADVETSTLPANG